MIFAGVLLALWTLGRPAHASAMLAPFCDDRGATALAPPPALEATDEAVRRTAAPPCDSPDGPIFGLSLGPAHHAFRSISWDAAPARPSPSTWERWLLPPDHEPLDFVAQQAPPPGGVRYRIERPPRG